MSDIQLKNNSINPEEIINELNLTETLNLCKSIGVTFEDIKELNLKSKQYTELEKEIKPLKDKIKLALLSAKAKKGTFGDVTLSITIQNRDTMDEDKLTAILKLKGLTDAIKIVEKPDPNKIPELLAEGLITDEELNSCMIPNKVTILNFPKKKATAQSVGAELVNNVATNAKPSKMF
jgi:hypothetical protein